MTLFTPKLQDAYNLTGDLSDHDLACLVKRLTIQPSANEPEDWERLKAARYILTSRKAKLTFRPSYKGASGGASA